MLKRSNPKGRGLDDRRGPTGPGRGPFDDNGGSRKTRMALLDRIAAAPISWGICEVPGWGHQLPVEQVLSEMASLGFTHTELGSIGFLPTDPAELRAVLGGHGLGLLGGFVPLVLHDPDRADQTRAAARRAAALISGAGGRFFVTCAVSGFDRWERPGLDRRQWDAIWRFLDEIDETVGAYGLTQAVHPHVGSLIELDAETRRLLDCSGASLVLDTAHLRLGGSDIVEMAKRHAERIGLVHLKDVDPALAENLTAGELTFVEAVGRGLFPPLGRGGAPIAEIVAYLEQSGRDLWYVLEQDAVIAEDNPSGRAGPKLGMAASIDFLRSLESEPVGAGTGGEPRRHMQTA